MAAKAQRGHSEVIQGVLPFETSLLGYGVRFEAADHGYVLATCRDFPQIQVWSEVVDGTVDTTAVKILILAAERDLRNGTAH